MKRFGVLLLAIALGAAAWWYWRDGDAPAATKYRTQAAERGDIVQTITANGTLSPLTVVQVGTQV